MSEDFEIPSRWKEKTLSSLADYHNGAAFNSKDWVEDGLPIIRIEQINKANSETDKFNGTLIPNNFINTGDLIFSWSATLKVVIWNNGPGALNQHLYKVVPKAGVNRLLLRYILEFNMDKLAGQAQGSAMKHVTRKELSRFTVILPTDENEQQKLVDVLSVIDQTIEKTEALTEKYQQIKAGLMHDLFTRGITADGKLRPPREQAPELYQETPIGWIPKDWSFRSCKDVCDKIIDCKNRTPPITPDGYPVIRTPNVRNGIFIDQELVFTDYRSYIVWTARGKPKLGDVVITREAPVGEVCKIPERHSNACLGQRMMLYRTDPEKIDNDYFLYALQSQEIQSRLDLISGGSTVGHVRVGDIRDLWMYLPESRLEQSKIAEGLNRISKKIEKEISILNKLTMRKSGLMHDLLTGKVPVNADEPEAANA